MKSVHEFAEDEVESFESEEEEEINDLSYSSIRFRCFDWAFCIEI